MYNKRNNRKRVNSSEEIGSNDNRSKYYCTNCGVNGHKPSECPLPVISCGVIVVRVRNNSLEYLLVRRRNSLSFIEFVRGKYDIFKEEYIKTLLSNMTQNEQIMLSSMGFKELWAYTWNTDMDRTPTSHIDEYIKSNEKFTRIASKFQKLIKQSKSNWSVPEWGFPKGRRDGRETDFVCAKREFLEETNLSETEYNIIHDFPVFEETFFGSNGVPYTHRYYIGIMKNTECIVSKDANTFMKSEIGDIKWMNYDEAITNIRPTNPEKKDVLTRIHTKVREYLKL